MKYYAKNKYYINGTTSHRTPEAACKAANRREGDGWIVLDEEGNQWSLDPEGVAHVVECARKGGAQ